LPPRRLEGRIALVTGASRGIGAAVARRFAAEGAHLILTARTVGGLEEVDDAIRAAGGGPATLVPLDLRESAEIDKLAPAIAGRFGRLDILVANAGVLGTLGPASHLEPAVWDEAVAVNLTANWRLIRALEPLLRASDAGRAIFVSSGIVRNNRAYWGAYAATKAGLEALVRSWAAELTKTPLRVNLINPGATRTRMRAAAMPGEDPETLQSPDDVAALFVDLADPACTRHGEVMDAKNFRSR
jgi:NAD(P)-dependent dehydrogenase (short-subunit alcohol dehydrogenase family)